MPGAPIRRRPGGEGRREGEGKGEGRGRGKEGRGGEGGGKRKGKGRKGKGREGGEGVGRKEMRVNYHNIWRRKLAIWLN